MTSNSVLHRVHNDSIDSAFVLFFCLSLSVQTGLFNAGRDEGERRRCRHCIQCHFVRLTHRDQQNQCLGLITNGILALTELIAQVHLKKKCLSFLPSRCISFLSHIQLQYIMRSSLGVRVTPPLCLATSVTYFTIHIGGIQ